MIREMIIIFGPMISFAVGMVIGQQLYFYIQDKLEKRRERKHQEEMERKAREWEAQHPGQKYEDQFKMILITTWNPEMAMLEANSQVREQMLREQLALNGYRL